MKKSASEVDQTVSNTHVGATISDKVVWLVVSGHISGRQRLFEDAELQAILKEGSCQSQ